MTKHRTPRIPPEERPYRVGYGKPDPAAGFKKGQVANPKGRPRKKGLRDELDEILSRKMTTPSGGKISIFQAIIQAQAANAIKGDTKAAAFLLRQRDHLPADGSGKTSSTLDEDDRRFLREWAERMTMQEGTE